MVSSRLAAVLALALATPLPAENWFGGGQQGPSSECKQKMQALHQEFEARKQSIMAQLQPLLQQKESLMQEYHQRKQALMAECGAGQSQGQGQGWGQGWGGQKQKHKGWK